MGVVLCNDCKKPAFPLTPVLKDGKFIYVCEDCHKKVLKAKVEISVRSSTSVKEEKEK